MYIESENSNVDIHEVLKEITSEEVLGYIQRVILINRNNADNLKTFGSFIINELSTQCTIRKFTILNTNVVKAHQGRVLTDVTLRAFYFELTNVLIVRLNLLYGSEATKLIINNMVDSYSDHPVCVKSPIGSDYSFFLNSPEYKELCSSVEVTGSAMEFAKINLWYWGFIVVNLYAPSLFESVNSLLTTF